MSTPMKPLQTALMTQEREAELRWFALNLRRLSPGNEGDSLIESLDAMAYERARADAALIVARAAARVVAAADACDREAERHPSSRSSAPVVRAINAMKALREALVTITVEIDEEP